MILGGSIESAEGVIHDDNFPTGIHGASKCLDVKSELPWGLRVLFSMEGFRLRGSYNALTLPTAECNSSTADLRRIAHGQLVEIALKRTSMQNSRVPGPVVLLTAYNGFFYRAVGMPRGLSTVGDAGGADMYGACEKGDFT